MEGVVYGVVCDRETIYGRGGTIYYITLTYECGGQSYTRRLGIPKDRYYPLQLGSHVALYCLLSNPKKILLADDLGMA